jgi:hypothetical protein
MKFELEGKQGKKLTVEGNTVKIIKKGGLIATKREKVLPFRNITSVEVKKPGLAFAGFIQFSIAGGQAKDSSFKISGGTTDAVKDENSVVFADSKSYKTALEIKNYFENYSEVGNNQINQISSADELEKFKKLLDNGAISESDYETKKKQLLGL